MFVLISVTSRGVFGIGTSTSDRAGLGNTLSRGQVLIVIIGEKMKYEGRINRIRYYGKGLFTNTVSVYVKV